MFFWFCRQKKIPYGSRTLIMGIVNVTPDSFSDGGSFLAPEAAVKHALDLVKDGADILDIGAQSTRPGYREVSPEEEWARLSPVLSALKGKINVPLSVDTYYPSVMKKAILAGADVINDVSGVFLEEKAALIKESGAGWIMMHNGAGGVKEVSAFFDKFITDCKSFGILKEQLCLDVGIGFGKSETENIELITQCDKVKKDGIPLLIGMSRKRIIGAISGEEIPENRLAGNVAADTVAILKGVDILRLHDVKNERKGIRAAEELIKWIK